MNEVTSAVNDLGILEIRSERHDDRHVVALIGDLDLSSVRHVDRELRAVETTDVSTIVLDLTRLEFIDSSGVQLVVSANIRARTAGHSLQIASGPGPVHRVFELTDLAGRLPFV